MTADESKCVEGELERMALRGNTGDGRGGGRVSGVGGEAEHTQRGGRDWSHHSWVAAKEVSLI